MLNIIKISASLSEGEGDKNDSSGESDNKESQ